MITFDDIARANSKLSGTSIKGETYIEVAQRVKAFRMVYPCGGITTEIIALDGGVVTIKATVTNDEGAILATGYAQEKEGSTYINKTSFIENCETSAVGRALGFCGFGIETSICSAEEVANAQAEQTPTLDETLLTEAAGLGIALEKVATYLKKPVEALTNEELRECIERKKKAKSGGGAK